MGGAGAAVPDVPVLSSGTSSDSNARSRRFDASVCSGSISKPTYLQSSLRAAIPVVPDPKIVDVCLDKYKTMLFAHSIGIPYPKSFIKLDNSLTAISSGEVAFPLILKPRWGQGSIAIKKIHSVEELTHCAKSLR